MTAQSTLFQDTNPQSVGDLEFQQDGTLFVIEHDGSRHFLNATAAIVLQLCDGETSIKGITAAVLELFGDVPDVEAHVVKCLDDLGRRGLLMPSEDR
jgi:hypothetical protein